MVRQAPPRFRPLAPVCLVMIAVTCAACGSDTEEVAGGSWLPEAERMLVPGHAPTPFTADQIRAACPEGRRSIYRMDKPGRPPFMQSFTFRNCDEEGAEFRVATAGEGQTPPDAKRGQRSTWKDFQRHASYPREATTITRAIVKIPAGRFNCLLYVVKREVEGKEQVTKAWFASELPGPPVRMEQHLDGARKMRMTLEKQEILSDG